MAFGGPSMPERPGCVHALGLHACDPDDPYGQEICTAIPGEPGEEECGDCLDNASTI